MAGFLVGANELGKLYWVEQFLLSFSNVVSHKHGLSGWIPPEKGATRMPATAGRSQIFPILKGSASFLPARARYRCSSMIRRACRQPSTHRNVRGVHGAE
jgi:hypothetical protein